MSAFLGPIHYWLYKKIMVQNNLTEKLLDTYDKSAIREALAAKYGELSSKPLEEIIDGSNIHGWLQQQVSLVEGRMAEAVTILLCTQNQIAMADLEKLAFEFGKANKPESLSNAKEWYAYLNDILLDGMPCDRINGILMETEDEVSWFRSQCIHKHYWDAVAGDVDNYYRLRDAFIAGMMDGSEFIYEKPEGDAFIIRRRA